MKQIEFFEYSINLKKCKIVKYKCVGVKIREKLYDVKFYNANDKYTGNHRLINLDNFEIIHSFRIMSFNDNYEYYRQILLNEYAIMIEKNRSKLLKQELFFKNLTVGVTH